MPKHVVVAVVRATGEKAYSPRMDADEAERQRGLIADALGTDAVPDIPWLAAAGVDIAAAYVYESAAGSGSAVVPYS
jgi:hypothetical protein